MKLLLSTRNALLALLFALLAGCSSTSSAPTVNAAPEETSAVEIRKSPNDTRAYRYLQLTNKLRMVLVSDPQTEKSAAALAVYRGSSHDPKSRPGLAHFLEHMLFIQTETYPEIDGFQHFISAHGGSSNAYTALDHTNYFFDVQPAGLREGLDRFAHFFIDPVLSPEYSAREKNAVNSEYQMQIKDDGWRGYMVAKQAMNPDHPASRFTIGSLETLNGDIHEDLMHFFETEYSADQMALVVISEESLDEMQGWIQPLFEQIVNKNIGQDYPDLPMYTADELPARLTYQTQKEGASISYLFPLPSTRLHYRNKPEQYVSNLVGHEGEGSLYQALKEQGWIESLSAGVSDLDRNNSALSINIELTPTGRDRTAEITDLLFRHIELIKATPPQRWMYEEQAKVAEIGFRFQEKIRPTALVYQLAPRIDEYPPQDLLVAPYLMEEFDADTIRELLSQINEDNVLVEIAASDIQGDTIEPWFNVPYTLARTPVRRKAAPNIDEVVAQLHLPDHNPYLPDDLALKTDEEQGIERFVERPDLTLWLDSDGSFGSPRANLYLELAVNGGLIRPADRAMAQLYRLLVEDSLSKQTYAAYLAGLGYSLSVPDSGFQIYVGGYQDKQDVLLNTVLQALLHAELNAERFASIKASLIKDWRNAAKERPFNQAYSALDDTLRSGRWPRPMLIEALKPVTLEDLIEWRKNKLASVGARGMLHGNVTAADAAELKGVLEQQLPLSANAFTTPVAEEVEGALLLQLPVDHDDAAIVLHVQDPDESFASRARSALAAQILYQPYFQDLRTEQQLGYVVSVTNRPVARRGGISFIVQSPNTSAAGLESATLAFVDEFVAAWPDMPEDEFQVQKSGLIHRLLEKPKNLDERSQRYWEDLQDEQYTFDSREQIAAIVGELSRDDMLVFLKRLQSRLKTDRLLIYTRGKFDEVPEHGRLLGDATQSRSDALQR